MGCRWIFGREELCVYGTGQEFYSNSPRGYTREVSENLQTLSEVGLMPTDTFFHSFHFPVS